MPFQSKTRSPKLRTPELEKEPARRPDLGYEAMEGVGIVRYLEHGFPTPLARWHYHDEFELHLILATSGRVFVGDYIGQFQPGHLVLTGPRVPHNWISLNVPQEGVALRDLVLQFPQAPFKEGVKLIPELVEILPLLERARHGIEFHNISAVAQDYFVRIKQTKGLQRLLLFYDFMIKLAQCTQYRLLSNMKIEVNDDDDALDRINTLVGEITDHAEKDFIMSEVAERFGMSESAFSRFFRRSTGNTFTDFVNRVRVSKACHLLMETDQYITNICYDVGFNNLANFNRRFLQIKGVTPKEYRRQVQERLGHG